MTASFKDFIQQSVDGFRDPQESSEMDEALASHAEGRVAELDLDTVRSAYPDLDEVIPEAKGVASDHPALAAAIEVAIQDAVHADRGTSYSVSP